MTLGDFPVRASIGVKDIKRSVAFYEGILGLVPASIGPSADIEGGARFYACGQGTMLNVFETPTAGSTHSTVATWLNSSTTTVSTKTNEGSAPVPAVVASLGWKIPTETPSRSRQMTRNASLVSSAFRVGVQLQKPVAGSVSVTVMPRTNGSASETSKTIHRGLVPTT